MASNVLHQVMSLEDVFSCAKPQPQQQQQYQKLELLLDEQQSAQQEKRAAMRPQPEQALRCPRCDSSNTKFCYYNNYSLSQPRYFCKGCRRYWTQGGTLRNVPVGGGFRKNKRPSSSTASVTCKRFHDQQQPVNTNGSGGAVVFPEQSAATDLAMALTRLHGPVPGDQHDHAFAGTSNHLFTPVQSPSFLDILRGGFLDGGCFYQQHANYELGGVQMAAPEEGRPVKYEPCASSGEMVGVGGAQFWQAVDGSVHLVDPARDYWGGGVAAPWHGLVNSSLM